MLARPGVVVQASGRCGTVGGLETLWIAAEVPEPPIR
jgi:hypothetical protein